MSAPNYNAESPYMGKDQQQLVKLWYHCKKVLGYFNHILVTSVAILLCAWHMKFTKLRIIQFRVYMCRCKVSIIF